MEHLKWTDTNSVVFFGLQIIESVVMTIANNFVTDRNSGEVMTVGWVIIVAAFSVHFSDYSSINGLIDECNWKTGWEWLRFAWLNVLYGWVAHLKHNVFTAHLFVQEYWRAMCVFFDSINAIREVVARCPLAMNEDLLQDLTLYKSHKDKSMQAQMNIPTDYSLLS